MEFIELQNAGTISRGKSQHRPRNDSNLYNKGTIPFVQTGDVKNATLYICEANQFYNELGLKQSKLWQRGTLCITIASTIAETAILGIDACFPDSIIGFIPNSQHNVLYIKYCFDYLKKFYEKKSNGTSQENLNADEVSKLLIPHFSLKEQRLITNIATI